MKLPNAEHAYVDDRKLLEYCLNPEHKAGKHKARVFAAALSITSKNFFILKAAILNAVSTEEAILIKENRFGKNLPSRFFHDQSRKICLGAHRLDYPENRSCPKINDLLCFDLITQTV